MEINPVWEKRPEESYKQYIAFSYFASLPKEDRTIDAAYDKYLEENNIERKSKTRHKAPQTWYAFANSFLWEDRAAAKDLYEREYKETKLTRLREGFKLDSMEDYNHSIRIWRKTLGQFEASLDYRIDEACKKGYEYNPKADSYALEKLMVTREKLDLMARRQLDLPTVISEDRFTQEEGKPFEIAWVESENKISVDQAEAFIEQQMQEKRRRLASGRDDGES